MIVVPVLNEIAVVEVTNLVRDWSHKCCPFLTPSPAAAKDNA